ncbi:putative HTH-type transcriptional regulator [compost metagenome]
MIKDRLADGNLGVEEVARHLCMSKRTLQRRLQELEMEFGELVEEIRQATAMDMVSHSPLSLTEIAQRLGYAEPSSFTRAFRRWSGLTPREFRRRLRK